MEFKPQLHTIYRLQPPGIRKKEWKGQLCKLTDANPDSNNRYSIIFLVTRATTTVEAKNLGPVIPNPFVKRIALNKNVWKNVVDNRMDFPNCLLIVPSAVIACSGTKSPFGMVTISPFARIFPKSSKLGDRYAEATQTFMIQLFSKL